MPWNEPGNDKDPWGQRKNDGPPDLVDVVLIANIQSRAGTDHPHGTLNWLELPAARRLGFAEEIQEIELEAMEEVVDEVKSLFE